MTSSDSPSTKVSPLHTRDWDRLISQLKEQRVIPVIGPDLLRIPATDGAEAKLYELWGKELAELFNVDLPDESADIPLLYWISDQLSLRTDIPTGDLESDLSKVVCQSKWPIPLPLLQLAEIKDFPLYISTTIDHLMEAALKLKRGHSKNIVFSRTGGPNRNDIPADFTPSSIPLLIHLFGASCVDREAFAVTEDDLIEFSWSLIKYSTAPENLYEYLNKRQLLLLGCNFPDWLDRFFIHALSHEHGAQVGITFVSEHCPKGLQEFLRRKKARPFIEWSPVAFVQELHQRWLQSELEDAKIQDDLQPLLTSEQSHPGLKPSKLGSVFISYARDDKKIALAIRDQLEAANIDTWMDDSDLEPGEQYEVSIEENIRNASFFIALISKSLDLENSNRLGRFVLKEWRWAEDADRERPQSQNFLLPVVIDDTPEGAAFIEGPMRKRQWTVCRDGELPAKFMSLIQQGVRRFRRSLIDN
jgi:hypothetical protein